MELICGKFESFCVGYVARILFSVEKCSYYADRNKPQKWNDASGRDVVSGGEGVPTFHGSFPRRGFPGSDVRRQFRILM